MNAENPLGRLIQDRMDQLGPTPEGLGARLGYRNPERAKGRVRALCDGHLTSRKNLAALARLPEALGVPQEAIGAAVGETLALQANIVDDQQRALEAEWRASFRPHAVILTDRSCPSQITICAVTGGIDRWLVIPLDLSRSPLTFIKQALAALPERLVVGRDARKRVPFFGEALGLIVNYSPDRAIQFRLDGEPMEVLPTAFRVGKLELAFGGRTVRPTAVARMMGTD